MDRRQHPTELGGRDAGHPSTPSTTTLVRRLADGDADAARPLRATLLPPLTRAASALLHDQEEAPSAVDEALDHALSQVVRHPDGRVPLAGGAWDAVGVGALALEALMEQLERPLPLRSRRLDGLDLQQRVLLLLVEVELLDTEDVAELFVADLDEVADHLDALREQLVLPDPQESTCPVWSEARVRRRLDGDALSDLEDHVDSCLPCAEAADEADARRDGLVRMVPGIGWTQLGPAVAAAPEQR